MSEAITTEQTKTEQAKPDTSELDTMKAELAKARAELDGFRSNNQTLNDKVKIDQDQRSKRDSDSKQLESALTFTLTSGDFLKQNESILPKGASDIFKAADKEMYDSPINKANAIKVGLIDLHFSQQSNVDFLTDDQKELLADYQKLTKNSKEEKSNEIYKTVFKPSIDTMKRVKKAEELARANQGYGGNTDLDQAYKDKLTKMAEKKFFRGKN